VSTENTAPTDAYARFLGVEITQLGGGHAESRVTVTENHLNPHGTTHGAFLFSVAGIALAAAANNDTHSGVVSHVAIDYLRPVRVGDELVATAEVDERLPKEDIFVVRVRRGDEVVARATGRANRRER
jgi:acyl-CoA thioesterase